MAHAHAHICQSALRDLLLCMCKPFGFDKASAQNACLSRQTEMRAGLQACIHNSIKSADG